MTQDTRITTPNQHVPSHNKTNSDVSFFTVYKPPLDGTLKSQGTQQYICSVLLQTSGIPHI